MKTLHRVPLILLTAGLLPLLPAPASTPSEEEAIKMVRSIIKSDRQSTVADALQLTGSEATAFWPLYHRYRAEMDKVGDGILKLVKEYAQLYPNVPDDRAKPMLKQLTGLEKKKQEVRSAYLSKTGKVLPAAKNLRFAQVENRLDLAMQIMLAAEVPLVPVEGRIAGDMTVRAATGGSEAGGVVVQTYQLTAKVIGINKAGRKVTLLSPDGIKETVKVGPDAVNFDQIRVGDTVRSEVTQELVVALAAPGEATASGSVDLVALAPKGAKPGGVLAEVTQVTATVSAIDAQKHTATLRFEDGTTKTLPVRSDVDLGKYNVGDKVVFSLTEMVALSVEKP